MQHEIRRPITLGHLIAWGKACSEMKDSQRRQPVGDIWMDSRKIGRGDVFLAIKGENDDGHKYVTAAISSGASAAIVSIKAYSDFPASIRQKLIAVKDPLAAVSKMAAAYRKLLNIPIVAVTGSNGKTTTRQFISCVLRKKFKTGETGGNWNNHIGVPLTLLRFRGDERMGAVEFGSNHPGEIAPLSKIVSPDIAVITNAGYAHIGNFGSIGNTADEKFSITAGLHGPDSFCLVNGDDRRLVARALSSGVRTVYFGMSRNAGIRAQSVKTGRKGGTTFIADNFKFELPMAGRHFVYNALPAIYIGRWFGISDAEIAEALASFEPDAMRGRISVKKNVNFIVDCYNANPSSMQSAISLLCDYAPASRRVAITGDMLELGRYAKTLHRQLGRQLGQAGIRSLIAVGSFAETVAAGAIKAGLKQNRIFCVSNAGEALTLTRKVLKKNDMVLLKGSRAVKLETVFEGY